MANTRIGFRILCLAASSLLLAAGTLQADVGDELVKLLANDGTQYDDFGRAVAIDGATAIIGASWDTDNGQFSGSAYLFDAVTGLQLTKLLASDGATGDEFGISVTISGTTAIVGARRDFDNGTRSGSAYLIDITTGMELAKLLPSDGATDDYFGTSVALCGTTAIVGSSFDDDNGSASGAAYLFDTTTGMQTAKLLPSDGAAGDQFGLAVGISGTTAIVGSWRDSDNGIDSGSAYLFDTVTGMQIAKLLPSDAASGDAFGSAVAISGTTAIVGARWKDDAPTVTSSGAAYLFDTTTGLQHAKLLPKTGANAQSDFGISVAISGTTAIVGENRSYGNGIRSGTSYLFDTVTGGELATLLPSDGETDDLYGTSVAVSGSTAIVGAYGNDDNGFRSGSAYLIEAPGPPALSGDVASISLATGGVQLLTLEGGAQRAGWFYFILGSVTGNAPGIDFGGAVILPLNFDVYMNLTLFKPGLSAFGAFRGTLDGTGKTVASITLPPLMDPSLVGVTLDHACLAAEILGIADFASNAVPVLLVP